LGAEGAQPCSYNLGLIKTSAYLTKFIDIKESGKDVEHIPPVFPLAEVLDELGDSYRRFKVVVGYQSRLRGGTFFGRGKESAAKGPDRVYPAGTFFKERAGGRVVIITGVCLPAFQAGAGKVVGGHCRRTVTARLSKFFAKPGSQVFRDDKAEYFFSFGSGDGHILRAAGTAARFTNDGQVTAPVGENRIYFM